MSSYELPAGYSFEETEHVTRGQVAVLYYPKFQHWSELQYLVEGYTAVDKKRELERIHSIYLGVQAPDGGTVGVGCLRYNTEEGELSCLAVMPQHQSLGIGKWIIAERIRRAQELGLNAVYIDQLAPTNTLASHYIQEGFLAAIGSEQVTIFTREQSDRQVPYLSLALNHR